MGCCGNNNLYATIEYMERQIDFKKLPCNKLAHAIGLHQSQMSRALNRKATPGVHALYRLSRALSSLLGWEVSLGELYKQLYPDMVVKYSGVNMGRRASELQEQGKDASNFVGKPDLVLSKSIGP